MPRRLYRWVQIVDKNKNAPHSKAIQAQQPTEPQQVFLMEIEVERFLAEAADGSRHTIWHFQNSLPDGGDRFETVEGEVLTPKDNVNFLMVASQTIIRKIGYIKPLKLPVKTLPGEQPYP